MRPHSNGRARAFDAMAELAKPRQRRRSSPKRFWARVNVDGPLVRPDLGRCWVWTGRRDGNGYGHVTWCTRDIIAHRLAYSLHHGRIPSGGIVMHACDYPPCCNPNHLSLGTIAQNNRDAFARGRNNTDHLHRSGSASGRAKLTEARVVELRCAWRAGESIKAIALRTGLAVGTVHPMLHGKTWAHVEEAS